MNTQYTEEERRNFLAAWRESEISGNQFCRENNIRPTTFYNWTKKERQKHNDKKSGIVKLPDLQVALHSENNIILEYMGWKITLPPGFNYNDASTAMKLVESINVS